MTFENHWSAQANMTEVEDPTFEPGEIAGREGEDLPKDNQDADAEQDAPDEAQEALITGRLGEMSLAVPA